MSGEKSVYQKFQSDHEKWLEDFFADEGVEPDSAETADWAFKWVDSRHLKAKWKLMVELDSMRHDVVELLDEFKAIFDRIDPSTFNPGEYHEVSKFYSDMFDKYYNAPIEIVEKKNV